ncbi:MAG: HD domain-containing protein [Desulfobacterium sp.]|nr:HD domain-containing protein [Desulfobacterium sp.]
MTSTGFESLFTTLSDLSSVKLEIRDNHRVIWPVKRDWPCPSPACMQDMARRVMENGERSDSNGSGAFEIRALPLKRNNAPVAVLMGYRQIDPQALQTRDKDIGTFLRKLADQVETRWREEEDSLSIVNELDRCFEQIHLYSNVATQIKTLRLSGEMLNHLLETILANLRMDLAFSLLPQRPGYSLQRTNPGLEGLLQRPNHFSGRLIQAMDLSSPSLDEGYFIVNDSRDHAGFATLHPRPFRFLGVRIRHGENTYGWFGVLSFNMEEIIRRSELRLLISIAEQIGVVIANSDLYLAQENFVINMVRTLVFAIEAKDQYTRGHSEQVHHLCRLMAEEMNLDEETKRILSWAALLHDIGKIGIPEGILNKPGRLDPDEYEIIKGHPAKGAKILTPLLQIRKALPGIRHHHEHYNGNGYPSGLKGEEIPFIARIIAVADTFDAITSNRAYRKGMPYSKGIEIITGVAGTQLDPKQVRVFARIYDKHLISPMDPGDCP